MQNQSMDLIGEFSGAVFDIAEVAVNNRTVLLYSNHLEIPEAGLSIQYEEIREVHGGSISQIRSHLSSKELERIHKFGQVILVRYKDEKASIRLLVMTWKADGIDGLDYCQIVLYRAFAAARVRAKNNGEPCYGIVGY